MAVAMNRNSVPRGTAPRRRGRGNTNKKNGGASQPRGNKGQRNRDPFLGLNPPFDPRMRQIGSPLNQGGRMKRGWIQEKDGTKRVNFLFNPSQLDLDHTIDPSVVPTPFSEPLPSDGEHDPTSPFYSSVTGSASIKLLYDRTYELFSPPRNRDLEGLANRLGVYADVAAWYVFLGMLEEMPKDWKDTLLNRQPTYVASYLFMGNRQVYYGWVNSIHVTYSHWTQRMIPARCAIDIGFALIPHQGKAPNRVGDADPGKAGFQGSWENQYPNLGGEGVGGGILE